MFISAFGRELHVGTRLAGAIASGEPRGSRDRTGKWTTGESREEGMSAGNRVGENQSDLMKMQSRPRFEGVHLGNDRLRVCAALENCGLPVRPRFVPTLCSSGGQKPNSSPLFAPEKFNDEAHGEVPSSAMGKSGADGSEMAFLLGRQQEKRQLKEVYALTRRRKIWMFMISACTRSRLSINCIDALCVRSETNTEKRNGSSSRRGGALSL